MLWQYVGHLPSHYLIHNTMKTWGVREKYKIEEGWLFFYFDSDEDRERVLKGGPYLIKGRPLILKHIPDKFAFNRRDYATVPLWVQINGLGSRFWTRKNLGGIASYIGKPLYMDLVTDGRKRHNYARVLVEINLAAPVVRKVPLRFSDGDAYDVCFTVENEPKFCHGCCAFGHVAAECPFSIKKDQSNAAPSKMIPDTMETEASDGNKSIAAEAATNADVSDTLPAETTATTDGQLGHQETEIDLEQLTKGHRKNDNEAACKTQQSELVSTEAMGVKAIHGQKNTNSEIEEPELTETAAEVASSQTTTMSETHDAVILKDSIQSGDTHNVSMPSNDKDVMPLSADVGLAKLSADAIGPQPRSAFESPVPQVFEGGPHNRSRFKGRNVS